MSTTKSNKPINLRQRSRLDLVQEIIDLRKQLKPVVCPYCSGSGKYSTYNTELKCVDTDCHWCAQAAKLKTQVQQ